MNAIKGSDLKMKKLVIGSIGVLSSITLFGMTLISAAVYSLYLIKPDIGGYDRNLGVFGTALKEIGTIPLILSGLLLLLGIYYLIRGVKE